MNILPEKHFNRFYWALSAIVGVVVILRCIYVPFSHDEVATFYFYIQTGDFIPFIAHPDANGHFLTSLTSWITFKFFGSMPWSLRIPCMGSFLVLTYSVFKINKLFRGVLPKLLFTSAFILSFNFVGFYSLCRGYGFSIGLLMLAMYYFFVFIRYGSFSHFLKFLLFSQLALTANLTLVLVILVLTAIVIVFQARERALLRIKNLLALFVHASLLLFWIKYGFFLQEGGALYYGGGDNYWNVTFKTLIEVVSSGHPLVLGFVVLLFATMSLVFLLRLFREKLSFLLKSNFALSFITLCCMIKVFYLLKILMNVNYPEDRTGLFFYLFFILALTFMVNELKAPLQFVSLVIPLAFLIQFVCLCNIEAHPWKIYETKTMPTRFFDLLKAEQLKSSRPLTIAGHRVREFIFGFINYNSDVKLSHMTSPEALQMNCDYALALEQDKPYYDPYYTEIASEKYWNFRLLKRKQPLERKLLFQKNNYGSRAESAEYFNMYERLDTTFNSDHPLQADFTFSIGKAPVPLDGWLVMQIDNTDTTQAGIFIRTPLNLLKYDWNGTKHFSTSLVSGNIPMKIKRIVVYLWNIKKEPVEFKMESFSLYQVNGEGVTIISEARI